MLWRAEQDEGVTPSFHPSSMGSCDSCNLLLPISADTKGSPACRFMIITSCQHGLHGYAWTREPQYGLQNWFDGATTIVRPALSLCLVLLGTPDSLC